MNEQRPIRTLATIRAHYEAKGWTTYDHWQETGPAHLCAFGFGARDQDGNRWSLHGTASSIVKKLVRAAGPDTPAEKLHAAADAILIGQDITTPEEHAWAMAARRRARELEAAPPTA